MNPRRIVPVAAVAAITLGAATTSPSVARSAPTGRHRIVASDAQARYYASFGSPPSRSAPTIASEAQEYVSLGRAVEHAATEQHARALQHQPAAPDRDPDLWRLAAIVEAVGLGAGCALLATRGRRRLHPSP